MPLLMPVPAEKIAALVDAAHVDLAFAKAQLLDRLLGDLAALADVWVSPSEPAAEPTLDADEARAVVAAPVAAPVPDPEPAPEPVAPRKIARRAKVDAEPEAEPAPSRIRTPKAAQVALPVQDAAPIVAEADGDGPF